MTCCRSGWCRTYDLLAGRVVPALQLLAAEVEERGARLAVDDQPVVGELGAHDVVPGVRILHHHVL